MSKEVIVSHYAGSISYGTNMPTSDIDFRGIFKYDMFSTMLNLPDEIDYSPEIQLLLKKYSQNEINSKGPIDGKLLEVRKFIRLALENNPNILETLFVDPIHIVETSSSYNYLVSIRNRILSKKIFSTYSGYAYAQLHRLRNHNSWINKTDLLGTPILDKIGITSIDVLSMTEDDIVERILKNKMNPIDFPMLVKPKQINFLKVIYNYTDNKDWNKMDIGLLDRISRGSLLQTIDNNVFGVHLQGTNNPITTDGQFIAFNKEEMRRYLDGKNGKGIKLSNPDLLIKFNQKEYELAMAQYNGFVSWKNTRNSKRLELEVQHGYDTKHMMHTVRLITQARDIANGKGLIVNRTNIDRDLLMDIRNGKYSYEYMEKMVTDMFAELEGLAKITKLPDVPTITFEEILRNMYL